MTIERAKELGRTMTPSQKLIQRLRNELKIDFPADTEVRRTFARSASKATGTWAFFLWSASAVWVAEYGSPFTVGELLKADSIEVYNNPNRHKEFFAR